MVWPRMATIQRRQRRGARPQTHDAIRQRDTLNQELDTLNGATTLIIEAPGATDAPPAASALVARGDRAGASPVDRPRHRQTL